MDDMILYHGSRNGLKGHIKPCSRPNCDFGQGFYMGTNEMQTKGLICNNTSATSYVLKFRLSEIPENKILRLEDGDWVYAILANRKRVPEFNELRIAKNWLAKLKNYDVIIGKIADDRMNEAMTSFSHYLPTILDFIRLTKKWLRILFVKILD